MILIALIVFIVIFSFLIEKKGRLEDEYRYGVGYRQARLVSMYSEGEGTLLYVDQAAREADACRQVAGASGLRCEARPDHGPSHR